MEASGMGGTAGQGDGGGEGQQQGGEGAGQGPDFAAMQSTLTQQGETLESMRDFLQSAPWQQIQNADGQEADGEDDPLANLDLGYLDPNEAALMDPADLQQRLTQTIQQAARSIAQQEMKPLQEAQQEMRREQQVNQLVGEFPEFGDPETAKQVVTAASQLAEQMGRPELANEPGFWRLTYMAGRAADAAQEEAGDIDAPATLESGAGATPGGGGVDLGDAIVSGGSAGRQGAGVLPFGGGRR